ALALVDPVAGADAAVDGLQPALRRVQVRGPVRGRAALEAIPGHLAGMATDVLPRLRLPRLCLLGLQDLAGAAQRLLRRDLARGLFAGGLLRGLLRGLFRGLPCCSLLRRGL